MDDDDENLVDWGYDDEIEEVIDASGPIEDEEDILASDGEHETARSVEPQPPPPSEYLHSNSSSSHRLRHLCFSLDSCL